MATQTLDGLTTLLHGLDLGAIPTFSSADPLHQPIDIFHAYLAEALQGLLDCDPQQAYEAIQPANTTGNGDLDIVLQKLKRSGGPDLQDLAADLVKKFPSPHPLFAVPWRDGKHIRFFLSPKALPRILLPYILDRGPRYGTLEERPPEAHNAEPAEPPKEKKAVIEFSSPNLGQDFRTDHLRSTILGAFVAKIHEAMGWHVVRVNYLGDWGKHIGLLGLGWMKYGSDEALGARDAFRHIHEMYARMDEELKPKLEAKKKKAREKQDNAADDGTEEDAIFAERDATFKRLEDGDPPAVELWEKLNKISVGYYQAAYRRLGLAFDDYSGESLVCQNPEAIAKIEILLKEKGIPEQLEDGSWAINFATHDAAKLGTALLRSKDGTTTYFLRDVATAMDRVEDYNFEKLVYVVGEQDHHFRQVFKAIELIGREDVVGKLQHLTFTKGPSQWGNEHLLGDILDRCEEFVRRAADDPSQLPSKLRTPAALKTLGINALLVLELNTKNKAHTIGLDAEMLMATEGETGLSLQLGYTKVSDFVKELEVQSSGAAPEFSSLHEAPWIEVVRVLMRFPAVMSAAYKSLEPAGILSYLFSLLDELGYCFEDIEEEEEEGPAGSSDAGSGVAGRDAARALLLRCAKQVLENGMRVLNITPIP